MYSILSPSIQILENYLDKSKFVSVLVWFRNFRSEKIHTITNEYVYTMDSHNFCMWYKVWIYSQSSVFQLMQWCAKSQKIHILSPRLFDLIRKVSKMTNKLKIKACLGQPKCIHCCVLMLWSKCQIQKSFLLKNHTCHVSFD